MTRLEIMKHHVRRIAVEHGVDPSIVDRHDTAIAGLLGDVQVNPNLPIADSILLHRPPMMRPRSTFEIYEALISLEDGNV
jgi:hypothetical protein